MPKKKPAARREVSLPEGYSDLLSDIKERIRTARVKAALAVNRELVLLYWGIGRDILARQEKEGWGAKVVDRLSKDLRREFPDMAGLSSTNLKYMRQLAQEWPDPQIGPQLVGQIPWGHNRVLLDKVKEPVEREWYVRATIENGWSRNVLAIHIDRELYQAKGAAKTNFDKTLPALDSDLANDLIKDPYKLDFLGVAEDAKERLIQRKLIEHMREFLIELGSGFAFMGSEYKLVVGGDEFFIDLLFYHTRLRAYVVVELKATEFKPEYTGKLNFYLSVVDDQLRHQDDKKSIGILLCKGKKNDLVVDYALRDMSKPMGVSEYELSKSLPEELKEVLPTVEDIEAELESSKNGESEDL